MGWFHNNIPPNLSCRGAFGFALAIPVLVGPSLSELRGQDKAINLKANGFKSIEVAEVSNATVEKSVDKRSSNGYQLNERIENKSKDSRVLISEVTIQGLESHPEKELLEFAVYDAMSVRPGSKINKQEIKRDLDSIYSTGWFSGVRMEPINGRRGVQLIVKVQPNPVLKKVDIFPEKLKISPNKISRIFRPDYGKTLNLNSLQLRVKELKSLYSNNGYSLATVP